MEEKCMIKISLLSSIFLLIISCANDLVPGQNTPLRSFETSFETKTDFNGFYIVPPGDYDSYHKKSSDNVYHGTYSHKAWILKARAGNNDGSVYLPHRAYPTIQFQKTPDGVFRTPCLVSLWVNLEMTLTDRPPGSIDDWFSFVTLTPDTSNNWSRTVLVNITPDGYVKLVHVPNQGEQVRIYQADSTNNPSGNLLFPQKNWVRLDVLIDFDSKNGYAKVWQNGVLISHAKVVGGNGYLAQAHFGLYASAAISKGIIYNDKLRIKEVSNESEAVSLINSKW
jgi:hypothetical protein